MPVLVDGLSLLIFRYPAIYFKELKTSRFLECDESKTTTFYRKYPQKKSINALLFKKRVQHLLEVLTQTLDEMNIPFWLSSGTCLGNHALLTNIFKTELSTIISM